MIRSAIRVFSRKRLGETTAAFWSDSELNGWINLACKDLSRRTKCLKTDDYLTTTESTGEYTLSTNFTGIIAITEVYYKQNGDSYQKLDYIDRTGLDAKYPGWQSADDGTPTKYYYDIEEDVIGFYQSEDSDNYGTNYARVYYAVTHTDIADDDNSPTLPEDLHLAVCDWVVATGLDSRGYGDKSNDAWTKYYGKVKDYLTERKRAKEDEEIIMIPERNL